MEDKNDILSIATENAAKAQGHYSQARVALNNVEQILLAAGSSLDRVLRVTIYISDIAFWEEVNEVYSEIFGSHKPARGVVPVGKLHLDLDVGFEVTAAL